MHGDDRGASVWTAGRAMAVEALFVRAFSRITSRDSSAGLAIDAVCRNHVRVRYVSGM